MADHGTPSSSRRTKVQVLQLCLDVKFVEMLSHLKAGERWKQFLVLKVCFGTWIGLRPLFSFPIVPLRRKETSDHWLILDPSLMSLIVSFFSSHNQVGGKHLVQSIFETG
jgi:hypothetical protein